MKFPPMFWKPLWKILQQQWLKHAGMKAEVRPGFDQHTLCHYLKAGKRIEIGFLFLTLYCLQQNKKLQGLDEGI
jgi:hypothetical protein